VSCRLSLVSADIAALGSEKILGPNSQSVKLKAIGTEMSLYTIVHSCMLICKCNVIRSCNCQCGGIQQNAVICVLQ
jgi:hypothetical protein